MTMNTPTSIATANAAAAFDQRDEGEYDGMVGAYFVHLENVIDTCREYDFTESEIISAMQTYALHYAKVARHEARK